MSAAHHLAAAALGVVLLGLVLPACDLWGAPTSTPTRGCPLTVTAGDTCGMCMQGCCTELEECPSAYIADCDKWANCFAGNGSCPADAAEPIASTRVKTCLVGSCMDVCPGFPGGA